MPVRWDVLIRPHEQHYQSCALYRCKPVASWDDAGADVAFVSTFPEFSLERDYLELQEQLRRLGRLTDKSQIWGSSGILPRFDGHSWAGAYTGDTPILFEVCEYIDDDLKRLFNSAPGSDIPYPVARSA